MTEAIGETDSDSVRVARGETMYESESSGAESTRANNSAVKSDRIVAKRSM